MQVIQAIFLIQAFGKRRNKKGESKLTTDTKRNPVKRKKRTIVADVIPEKGDKIPHKRMHCQQINVLKACDNDLVSLNLSVDQMFQLTRLAVKDLALSSSALTIAH